MIAPPEETRDLPAAKTPEVMLVDGHFIKHEIQELISMVFSSAPNVESLPTTLLTTNQPGENSPALLMISPDLTWITLYADASVEIVAKA
jgi:hypothetical protein